MSNEPRAPLEQLEARFHDRVVPAAQAGSAPVSPVPADDHGQGSRLWLHRLAVLSLVLVCAVVGVLLVILPWSLAWADNRLLWSYPQLRVILGHAFVRGLCSGLGILDLWIGFSAAIHYHEGPKPSR